MNDYDFVRTFLDVALKEQVLLIDEYTYDKLDLNLKHALIGINFKWDDDSELSILSFVRMAKYLKTIIIKHESKFYIFHDMIYFCMSV